jgi:ParB-like chromosome segregation protein Spo0J
MANSKKGPTSVTRGKAQKTDPLSSKITTEPTTAAPEYKFHPLADLVPKMSDEDYAALAADIKANGLNEHIILHEGMILDGRHRYRACLEAGIEPYFLDYLSTSHGQRINNPAAYVLSVNVNRRHLDAEGKRKAIADLIKAHPEKSDRAIAKMLKTEHKKVGRVRKAEEATGAVAPVEKRIGGDGKARKQPATKPPTVEVIGGIVESAHEVIGTTDAIGSSGKSVTVEMLRHRAEDNKPRKPRKLTKKQQERQDYNRREREQADRVVAVLIERLGRDWIVPVYAAMEVTGLNISPGWFNDAVFAHIKGTPDQRLVEELYDDVEVFIAKFGSGKDEIRRKEGNAGDPEASAEAMKAKFAAIEEPLASNGGAA